MTRILVLAACAVICSGRANAAEITMLAREAEWNYHDQGLDLGTAWRTSQYADSSWMLGPAPLGYGYPSAHTIVSYGNDPDNRNITTYFRTRFTVNEDPASLSSLVLEATYDDGFVAYLNGYECGRRSVPPGLTTYGTLATSHDAGTYEVIDLTGFLRYVVPGENVLAVELHQSSPSSDDLLWDAALTASNVPTLSRGPYLQIGTSEAMTIRWRTVQSSLSVVRYGLTRDDLSEMSWSPVLTTEHEITLTGLTPDTKYYYGIGVLDTLITAGTEDFAFITSPSPGVSQPTRVWVIGDSGLPGENQRNVRDAYYAFSSGTRTDVWLMLGDNAYYDGTDAEYQAAVFDVYTDMLRTTPVWPTRGNHDRLHGGNDYYGVFTLPRSGEAGGVPSGTERYYSFDFSNIHFLCLDSEGSVNTPGSGMLNWLENDLASTVQDWVIAYWHHPPYSKGSHDSDEEARLIEMRENVLPVLEDGGVDLVLCGHSHSYERSFLLDEHYDYSWTLADSMVLDAGDGAPSGDGAYVKAIEGIVPHSGTVYAVNGSSALLTFGTLDHPVMVRSLARLGSLVLDIDAGQLNARFLDDQGVIRDVFAIVKDVASPVPDSIPLDPAIAAEGHRLRTVPNPARRSTTIRFQTPARASVVVSILDASGRMVRELHHGVLGAGSHELTWDGTRSDGQPVPAGVYFVRVRSAGRSSTTKAIRTR